jgi:enamine deaminase RidA (YjgF/YER057c/UK114 family)
MTHEIIHPRNVHSTKGVGYAHVAKVGPTLYIAGQIALDIDGHVVGQGDIEVQVRQVYTNLTAILEELGGSLANIVKLTTYLTKREHLAGLRKVRNEVFPEPFPPNTLLFIGGLASEDYLVEIEAIAVIDDA